jgi:hypothetical protein
LEILVLRHELTGMSAGCAAEADPLIACCWRAEPLGAANA